MPRWAADVLVVFGLFVVAWVVSRLAGRLAGWVQARRAVASPGYRSQQRETAVSLAQTSVRYVAFLLALVLSVIAVSGGQRIETVAGASFVAVIVAFAAQRFLTDIVAGMVMIFERWFAVG